jgi:hypothetical protein
MCWLLVVGISRATFCYFRIHVAHLSPRTCAMRCTCRHSGSSWQSRLPTATSKLARQSIPSSHSCQKGGTAAVRLHGSCSCGSCRSKVTGSFSTSGRQHLLMTSVITGNDQLRARGLPLTASSAARTNASAAQLHATVASASSLLPAAPGDLCSSLTCSLPIHVLAYPRALHGKHMSGTARTHSVICCFQAEPDPFPLTFLIKGKRDSAHTVSVKPD